MKQKSTIKQKSLRYFIIVHHIPSVMVPSIYKTSTNGEKLTVKRVRELADGRIHPPRKDRVHIEEVSKILYDSIRNIEWIRD